MHAIVVMFNLAFDVSALTKRLRKDHCHRCSINLTMKWMPEVWY